MQSARQKPFPAGYQLSMVLDSAKLRGMSAAQKRDAVALLASSLSDLGPGYRSGDPVKVCPGSSCYPA